jgi:hypothetical protein
MLIKEEKVGNQTSSVTRVKLCIDCKYFTCEDNKCRWARCAHDLAIAGQVSEPWGEGAFVYKQPLSKRKTEQHFCSTMRSDYSQCKLEALLFEPRDSTTLRPECKEEPNWDIIWKKRNRIMTGIMVVAWCIAIFLFIAGANSTP